MSDKVSILVVDDNEDIRDLLEMTLAREGYQVIRAKNAENALKKAQEQPPQLILLDIMMPDKDGITLCRELRTKVSKDTRIVFLTARHEEYSEVAGFEAGADDYISKPIRARALVRRLKALLQRDRSTDSKYFQVGDLIIDPNHYGVSQKGQKIALRRREFELLYFLAQHPECFFSREELMKQIWGDDVYITPRTVDVHIRRIREKIGHKCILTLKGVGYAFKT